jgi:hypothetical protein
MGNIFGVSLPPTSQTNTADSLQRLQAAIDTANRRAKTGWANQVAKALHKTDDTSSVLSNAIFMRCGGTVCHNQKGQDAAHDRYCRQLGSQCNDRLCRSVNGVCVSKCKDQSRETCQQLKEEGICAVKTSNAALINGRYTDKYDGCVPVGTNEHVGTRQLCYGPCKNGAASNDCVEYADATATGCTSSMAEITGVQCQQRAPPCPASCAQKGNMCVEVGTTEACVEWWMRTHPLLQGTSASAQTQRKAAEALANMADNCSGLANMECEANSECEFDYGINVCQESFERQQRRRSLEQQRDESRKKVAQDVCAGKKHNDESAVCRTRVADATDRYRVLCQTRFVDRCYGKNEYSCMQHASKDACTADNRCTFADDLCVDNCDTARCVQVRSLNECPKGFRKNPRGVELTDAMCQRDQSACDVQDSPPMQAHQLTTDTNRKAACIFDTIVQTNKLSDIKRERAEHALKQSDLNGIKSALNAIGASALQNYDVSQQSMLEPGVRALAEASVDVKARAQAACAAETAQFNVVYKSCVNSDIPCSITNVTQNNEQQAQTGSCLQQVMVDTKAVSSIMQRLKSSITTNKPGPAGLPAATWITVLDALVACIVIGSAASVVVPFLLNRNVTLPQSLRRFGVAILVGGTLLLAAGGIIDNTKPPAITMRAFKRPRNDPSTVLTAEPYKTVNDVTVDAANVLCARDKNCLTAHFVRSDNLEDEQDDMCPTACYVNDDDQTVCRCPRNCVLDKAANVCFKCGTYTGTVKLYKAEQTIREDTPPELTSAQLMCLSRVDRTIFVKKIDKSTAQWNTVSSNLYVRGAACAGAGVLLVLLTLILRSP